MRPWRNRSKGSRWLAVCLVFSACATGQDLATRAWRLESSGDGEQALASLRQAATAAPNDPVALRAYAEFLERHHDPAARETYARLGQVLQRTSAPAGQLAAVARRLAVLDLLAGDREASVTRSPGLFRGGRQRFSAPAASDRRNAQLHRNSRTTSILRAHGGAFAGPHSGRVATGPGPQRYHRTATAPPQPTKRWSKPSTSSW